MISSFVWLIRRSHIFSMLFLQTFYNDAHVNYFSFCHNFFFFFVASSRLQNFNCKTTHDKGKDEKRMEYLRERRSFFFLLLVIIGKIRWYLDRCPNKSRLTS